MSIERVFHCDGPDCERHVRSRTLEPPVFVTTRQEGNEQHFCGWDCVLRYAGMKEPEEVIASGPFPGDD